MSAHGFIKLSILVTKLKIFEIA